MNDEERCENLLSAGFSEAEIKRLSIFRREYIEKERQHKSVKQNRLNFLRWLVSQGKLTDWIAWVPSPLPFDSHIWDGERT